MPNLENFELAVVYTNDKRYIVSFEVLKGILSETQIDEIKKAALKEIHKQ